MRKVNFHTLDNLTVPEQLIEKALAIPNTEKPRRRIISGRTAIAAAIIALFIGVFTIYGIYIMPTATVFMESRESVVLTLNSRGNVLSATDRPELGGRSAEEAVRAVAMDMIESGALSAEENTLLLGTQNLSDEARAQLTQTVQDVFAESRFHGAIVSLPCSEKGAKAAVIDRLMQSDDSLSRERLKELSVNELNLLLHEVKTDGILLIGDPTESSEPHRIADVRKPDGDKPPNEPQTAIPPDTTVGELPSSDVGDLRQPELIQTVPDATQTATGNADPTEAPVTPTSKEKATAPSEIVARPAPTQMPTKEPTSAPTQESTSSPTETLMSIPSQPPTDQLTKPFGKESLLAKIPQSEIITKSESFGYQVPFEQLTKANYRDEMIQNDDQIAVINSSLDFLRFQGYAESIENTELYNFLAGTESAITPDNIFFRDNALIVAACYYTDDENYRSPKLESIQRSGNTMYLSVHCDRRITDAPNDTPLLHKYFVSAKVSKNDLQNIETLKLVFTGT